MVREYAPQDVIDAAVRHGLSLDGTGWFTPTSRSCCPLGALLLDREGWEGVRKRIMRTRDLFRAIDLVAHSLGMPSAFAHGVVDWWDEHHGGVVAPTVYDGRVSARRYREGRAFARAVYELDRQTRRTEA